MQVRLNNTVSSSDPGLEDLIINIFSARSDTANTDISSICNTTNAAHPSQECVFTYQVTASIPSTHYLVLGATVNWASSSTAFLQTYQVEINSYATLTDLTADTNPIATHDSTDVLRNDVVRLIFIEEPTFYQVSITGATALTDIAMYATSEGANSPIDNYMTATGSNVLQASGTMGVWNAVLPAGQYILAVDSGATQVNTLVLNTFYTTPGKSCHFNSAWEDAFGVFPGCVAASVAAPTLTAVQPPAVVDYTFTNSKTSTSGNDYYRIRYNLGSRAVDNYLLIKLLGTNSSNPYVTSLAVELYKGLSDTSPISIGHRCNSSLTECTFSYIITQAADYYLLIYYPYSSFGASFHLETLHIAVDAFDSLTAFNAGMPSISSFPLQETDGFRQ